MSRALPDGVKALSGMWAPIVHQFTGRLRPRRGEISKASLTVVAALCWTTAIEVVEPRYATLGKLGGQPPPLATEKVRLQHFAPLRFSRYAGGRAVRGSKLPPTARPDWPLRSD